MKKRMNAIPVIDLFAGPGGLGEGFSSYSSATGRHPFRLAISIEMERWAHTTLRFRSFMRHLGRPLKPEEWRTAAGTLEGPEALMRCHVRASSAAKAEALQRTLGVDDPAEVRARIAEAVEGGEVAVLIGGPPCQAYSLVGRARNRGTVGYVPEADHRQRLYVEYLQVLADHDPSVFVMENVKGLRSASLNRRRLFDLILADLRAPAKALAREGRAFAGRGSEYDVVALVASDDLLGSRTDFVVRAERFGVPQARHRVILLGIKKTLALRPGLLLPSPGPWVRGVLKDLPRLRSGVSDEGGSGAKAWRHAVTSIRSQPWVRQLERDLREKVLTRLRQVAAPRAGMGANWMERRESPDPSLSWLGQHIPPFVLNHSSRTHMVADLHRYFFAACWAEVRHRSPSLADFPLALLPEHANVERALNGELFADRFRVQVANRPATTVTSHIAKDGHYFIHPDPRQCRSLTVREAARLQTFPEDYLFTGPRTAQYQQVGNAVPPHLASQIAALVFALLDGNGLGG